jgi:hypothetical protein
MLYICSSDSGQDGGQTATHYLFDMGLARHSTPDERVGRGEATKYPSLDLLAILDQSSPSLETLRDLWEKIAIDYSRRALTDPLDKLPALSGLASRFHTKFKSRYFAGI